LKAYLLITGLLFGLAGIAHLVRVFAEAGHSLSADPLFYVENFGLFIVGGGFALWALRLHSQLGLRLTKDEPGRER
jgi:hypothetical protein